MFKKESSGLKRVSIKTTYQSKSWRETEGQFKPNDWEEQHLQKCGRIRGAQQGMVENFKGENILSKARGDSTHQPEEGGCAEGPVWQEMQPSVEDLGQAVATCPGTDTPAWLSFYPPISCQCLPWAKPEWKVEIKGACCCTSRRAGWKRVKNESRKINRKDEAYILFKAKVFGWD